MKISYYKDTDTMYIDFEKGVRSKTKDIAPGILGEFDNDGNLVGIEIDTACNYIDLSNLKTEDFPIGSIVNIGKTPALAGAE